MGKVRELNAEYAKMHGKAKRALVVTFGCQMNERDSEKLAGLIACMGFEIQEENRAKAWRT